ncbi:RDD family protein [Teredinibacter turnerae]|uniref:RDD family protein n=1 Tax=Teredinibacter turnerae TaxID=2426 RepID=UPI0003781A7A|nr:RDD family protein [Teredinibacter turnerae]
MTTSTTNPTPASEFSVTHQGASLWRRLIALVYDSFLLGALTMAYGAVVTIVLLVIQGDTTAGEYRPMITTHWGNALFLGGLIVTLAGFYVFFWCRGGQTAGMRAWRLQVVKRDALPETLPPSFKQSTLRALLAPLSLLIAGAGYWWQFFDEHSDCLHDRWSDTRVILTPPRKKKRHR